MKTHDEIFDAVCVSSDVAAEARLIDRPIGWFIHGLVVANRLINCDAGQGFEEDVYSPRENENKNARRRKVNEWGQVGKEEGESK